jgi:predicted nucleic acid-binding protein
VIVLDTNVLSALMRPERNEAVVAWSDQQPAAQLWTTSFSLMEIRTGLLLMSDGRRRADLVEGFARLLAGPLLDRILPLDADSAEAASRVAAVQQRRGINAEFGDYQIAGIVISRQAILATRNVKAFRDLDIPLVNPWEA